MTLQERYDAEKATAQALGQRHQQARAQLLQLEQDLVRADARMALLEDLLKPEPKDEAL